MFSLRFDLRAPATGAPASELYAAALDMAVWAEQHGCASVVLSEHHGSPDGYLPSPMLVAAAMAARTRTLPITVGALLLNFVDPIRLAEDMVVLDLLSGGRVGYIIGLGYRHEEYAMFGVDRTRRGAVIEAKLDALQRALRGEHFEYEGRTVHVTPSPFSPGGPFLAYGGHSIAAARRAGRFGLSLLGESAPDGLEEAYLAAASEAGQTPGMVFLPPAGSATSVFVARDVDAAWAAYGPHLLHDAQMYAGWLDDDHDPVSMSRARTVEELRAEGGPYRILTPDEAVEHIRTHGMLAMQPLCGGLPPEQAWQSLETLASDVLPRLG